MNGKNYLEDAIKEDRDATAHGGVEKTFKCLTDKYICQPFNTWQVAIPVNGQSIATSHH